MPIINLSVSSKADVALSGKLAEQIATLTKKHLKKDPTVTAVTVSYIDPAHWFVGGPSLAKQGKNSFWLDIKVVDGTNTKQEMEAYLSSVFAEMANAMVNLHEESYILVHEVPAAAYGFGGKSQEFRFIKGRISA